MRWLVVLVLAFGARPDRAYQVRPLAAGVDGTARADPPAGLDVRAFKAAEHKPASVGLQKRRWKW